MIKVLHVVARLHFGGAEMRTVEVMPLLKELGVSLDFCVIGDSGGKLEEQVLDLGAKIIRCPLSPSRHRFAKQFVSLLRASDYNIVHSHGHLASGYMARLAYKGGIKGRVVHFRSMGDGKKITLKRRIYHCAMRYLIDRYATAILAVSYGAMVHGWKSGWQNDARCRVIHNGLDLTRFDQAIADRSGIRSELGIPPDVKLVIYVARFIPEKAHDVLLDAVPEVLSTSSKIHFLLVGDGHMREEVQRRARKLDIENHVHFLGIRTDVPRLLKGSDCFVSPSLREGLPGAVLEAVAAELPVVATDLPGVREIAQHTDLINIIPLQDTKALVEAIIGAVGNAASYPPTRKPFPQEFDLHTCANRLFEVYSAQMKC